ncbi:MAG: FeoB small GTPase domain-containing protein, partial [Bdellovibrionales bacterium]
MTVALVGSPNSGKTTLFNWLTGSKARTVNYAGSTVDCLKGESLEVFGPPLAILDTPGIYSLRPHGRDEEVTLQALSNQDDVEAVIIVVDGTQLNRQLYLIRQIQEMGIPFVVALTMSDLVRKSGREIDVEKLSRLVDAPVVPVEGRLGGGVKELMTVARTLVESAGQTKRMTSADLNWDEARIEREIHVSEDWTRQVLKKTPELESLQRLRRFDRIFLHPVLGVITFLLIMGALFSSIFWVASPAMDFVGHLLGVLAALVSQRLGPGVAGEC